MSVCVEFPHACFVFTFQRKEPNLAILQEQLIELYGGGSETVLKQVTDLLASSYHGNLEVFMSEFFQPTVLLLKSLQEVRIYVRMQFTKNVFTYPTCR